MKDLVDELDSAKETYGLRLSELKEIKARRDRFSAIVNQLKADLAPLAGVEEAVNAYQLDALERGDGDASLPDDLAQRLEQFRNTTSLLSSAEGREREISEKVVEAEGAVAAAKQQVRDAVGALYRDRQRDVFAGAVALEERLIFLLRTTLSLGSTGYGSVSWNELSRWVAESPKRIFAALNSSEQAEFVRKSVHWFEEMAAVPGSDETP